MNPAHPRTAAAGRISALRIPAHEPAARIDLPAGAAPGFLTGLYHAIGAECVEAVTLTSHWSAWVDEDGAGLPVNHAATAIAGDYGVHVTLHGTVILLGSDPRTGIALALSPAQIDTIGRRLGPNPPAQR
jgi:hypothetical protein